MYLKKIRNHNSGSTMLFILLLLMIIMIFITGINYVFSSNLKMSVNQEEQLRAHYLTLSGIDITKSTLMSTLYVDEEGIEKTMLDKIRNDSILTLKDSISIDGEMVNIEIIYDKNNSVITIQSNVELESGLVKKLILDLKFSGNQYKEQWRQE